MKPYNIEIKKLNFQPAMSQETPCFKGLLYINSKKAAEVANNGMGEMTRFHWLTPEFQAEYGADEDSIETVIYKHLDSVLETRDRANAVRRVKRLLSEGLYFSKVGVADKWFGYTKLKGKEQWDKARAKLATVEGVDKILNDIPIEEALPYFYKFQSK